MGNYMIQKQRYISVRTVMVQVVPISITFAKPCIARRTRSSFFIAMVGHVAHIHLNLEMGQ